MQVLPSWKFWSLAANAVLVTSLGVSLWRQSMLAPLSSSAAAALPHVPQAETVQAEAVQAGAVQAGAAKGTVKPVKQKRSLTYQQAMAQLKDDAKLVAAQNPQRLVVLAGDSISLWFPDSNLPGHKVLNQGISGEGAAGLLKRLDVFEQVSPDGVFVMIGINDMLRGKPEDEIVEQQQQVIRRLKETHPHARIVLQSVLPHATERVTWEGRDRLLAIPNFRIRHLNQRLEAIAKAESIEFFNLYPLFSDSQGDLRRELSSDGLHLNDKGYEVWGIALQVYSEEVLKESRF